jgi:hypothetical protein
MHTCKVCNETKPIKDFVKSKYAKLGYRNECKACHNKYFANMKINNPKKYIETYTKTNRKCGHISLDEYASKRAENAAGKIVITKRKNHKRRNMLRAINMSELDKFVFDEAAKLCIEREKHTKLKWHIDHIIPLHHKDACGLHVAANFQVVPASWNLIKRNKNMDIYFGK